MREHKGGRQGAANAGRKGAKALERERERGGGREQVARGSGVLAKAKILAKLRRLHPMD